MATKRKSGSGATFIQRSRSLGAAEKAAYHQIAGAGKRHVKRPFFELTQDDADAIADRVGQALDRSLKHSA